MEAWRRKKERGGGKKEEEREEGGREAEWILLVECYFRKMSPTIKSFTRRRSFESSFHTDHNGTTPSFIPHSRIKV